MTWDAHANKLTNISADQWRHGLGEPLMSDIDRDRCPDAQALMEHAASRTGLDDFGDPARNLGLGMLTRSITEESWAGMTPRSRVLAIDYLSHLLENRLRMAADRKAHPQIASEAITRPLIVVGPPRSGSTLLHNLLSLDPDSMAPEHWLCSEPSPPPALGKPSPARLESANRQMTTLFGLIPDIFVTHPYMIEEGAGSLAECGSDIMSLVFTSQQLWCFWGGETYRRFLLDADHTAALSFHREFLQAAQWRIPGKHWALKGSDHMLWLRELARLYPDATLVWTHRDLAQQLGSLASVQSILRGLHGRPVTPEARRSQGRKAIDLQHAAIEKAMRSRDAIGEERFVDVSYHDLLADPVASVRRIYEKSGRAVSQEHEQRIRRWLADHHQTKHGVHRHSPEEFGMDGEEINTRFAAYRDRFGFGFGVRPELMSGQ
ncbi:sulfotransferase [Novosphingobium sp. PS1R-30]|uniref:Sulfotransferase n=1 Tax=Novosphingobium anseongense TaxID=3133436 RepID=A0ABU8S0H4_9SPHN